MEVGLNIILLNGKYKMFGLSKALLNALDNTDLIAMFYSKSQKVLIFNKGNDKRKCFSYQGAEETKDYYWVDSELFVNRMEKELAIFRNYVAICLQGQVDEMQGFGKCVVVDISSHEYVSLGFENMPPTIEKRYHRLNHLYNNTFRI